MTTKTTITLVCDWCGSEDIVETYSITVNGQKFEFEACHDDYQTKVLIPFAVIARTGRRVTPEAIIGERKYTNRSRVEPMPGTDWRFTSHALIRMGERHLSPMDVIKVADNPEITHTSASDDGLFVYQAGRLRITVDPRRKAIVTAALRDEAEVSPGNISMEGAS